MVRPIFSVGKSAKEIEISMAVMTSSTHLTNRSTSNDPSWPRNFIRFRLARLHEESLSDMYSLHGFDA